MTEQRPIPKPMMAALSGALDEWFGAKTLDVWPDWDEGATEAATALLNSATVREEWGVRLTVRGGEIPDCWRESREAAEAMVAWHIGNRSIATPALIRRLHLTLPVEVVETEEQR